MACFAGTDACVAPVLSLTEATRDPRNAARSVFTEAAGFPQPSPAPRFDRTPAGGPGLTPHPGEHTGAVLTAAEYGDAEIDRLERAGAVRHNTVR
jgi:alpha-methylacyl-CoA racemase